MTLTYDQYVDLLMGWCKFRGASLKNYFPLKGGWEAWVQADYAAYVLAWNSTIDILREVPIYKNKKQRVDLLFNNTDPAVANKIAIELKCQSFDNRDAYDAGMGADTLKLAQANLNPVFQTCQTGVMGLFFTEEAKAWMETNGFILVFNNGEVGCGVKKLN